MSTLVTGASGFLGGALTRALAAGGRHARVLARATSDLRHLEGLGVEVVRGALEDRDVLFAAAEGARVVYHCAARSADWGTWEEFHAANVRGVRNLLDAATAAGSVERFVHVSTTDVYGYPRQACDETHPLVDTGLPYNRSKIQGEQAVWDCHRATGLPVTVIRPATIYGPRSKDVVAEFAALLRKRQMVLLDGGEARAGLIYVDNAVEAIIEAAGSPATVGKAYNLRDEGEQTWRDYVIALASGLGTAPPRFDLPAGLALGMARISETAYRALRVRRRPLLTRHAVYLLCRDQGYAIGAAQRDFGLRSRVGFGEGMDRTVAWLLG
jgi:nucleoside-diphosphate-sugar epimerase